MSGGRTPGVATGATALAAHEADTTAVHGLADTTKVVLGPQTAVAAITPSNLPALGVLTLLTDVITALGTLQAAVETRLDTLDTKVNALIAAGVTSGLLAP